MRRLPVRSMAVLIALLVLAPVLTLSISAQGDNPAFQRTWERTDRAVADGTVSRTWIWGDLVTQTTLLEAYAEAPGGQRQVLYYDKARMEDNSWRAPDAPWDVTNGLLVVELATGMLQTGDAASEERAPSNLNVAGDADDPTGPTYTTIGGLFDEPAHPEGATIDWTVDRAGAIEQDSALGAHGVTAGPLSPETGHRTASVFWEFMNSSGPVWVDEQLVTDTLFPTAYYATGLPVTEAYWANVKVAGTYRYVLLQCFERRCLTYTPDNPEGWQTEMGNVGQHYHAWRYTQEERYEVLFGAVNDSGLSGFAELTLAGNQLTLALDLSGLEPAETYAVYIHGPQVDATGAALQTLAPANCPTPAMAGDDGILTEEEGAAVYRGALSEPGSLTSDSSGRYQGEVRLRPLGFFFGSMDENVVVVHRTASDPDSGTLSPVEAVGCGYADEPNLYDFTRYYQIYISSLNGSEIQGSAALGVHNPYKEYLDRPRASLFDIGLTVRRDGDSQERWTAAWFSTTEDNATVCEHSVLDRDNDGVLSPEEMEDFLDDGNWTRMLRTPLQVDEDGFPLFRGSTFAESSPEESYFFLISDETDLPLGCGTFDPIGPGTQFGAFLVGGEVVPPVETTAAGFVTFTWNEDNTFTNDLIGTGLTGVTGAHLHRGLFGQNEREFVSLFTTEEPIGAVNGMLVENAIIDPATLGDSREQHDFIMTLSSQGFYACVNTSEHPDGELRGQVGPTIPDVYTTGLTGNAVVPPVDTVMSGSAAFLVNPELGTMSYQIIVANAPDVTSAYLHLGEPGANGSAVVTLYDVSVGERPANGILWQGPITSASLGGPLTGSTLATLIESFENGGVYVIVNTEEHPTGEIRGQPSK